jgi:hypothetical protein
MMQAVRAGSGCIEGSTVCQRAVAAWAVPMAACAGRRARARGEATETLPSGP